MIKKILFSAVLCAAALFVPTTVFAFETLDWRWYDDFERPSLGVDAPGNTGSGVEPDASWVHTPDGFVVYWIQYNTTTEPAVKDGALEFKVTGEDGWVGFGMTGDYKDPRYDAFSVKMKGAKGGEESGLYFNISGVFDFKWDNARDPDGNPLPPITTEWQTFVISLANSGMGATKAQRNVMAGGWTDLHVNSTGGPTTVYIDEVKQLITRSSVVVAPAETTPAPTAEPAAVQTPAPSETDGDSAAQPDEQNEQDDGEEVYPDTDRPLNNSFLVDDFNRKSLLLDPEMEVAPGGEFGYPNTDGGIIYWIQFNDATRPVIENGALKLTAEAGGWYGTASDAAFLDEYNCLAFRIKGEKGGEEKALTLNPDTLGAKPFSALKDPDGNPVPPITTEWQTIVVDLVKSGWSGLSDNKEFYQNIHLNTNAKLTVYIDEIYFTAVNLADDLPQPAPTPVADAVVSEDAPKPTNAPTAAPTAPAATEAVAQAADQTAEQATDAPVSRASKGDSTRLVKVIVLSVVIVAALTGIVVLLTRKNR